MLIYKKIDVQWMKTNGWTYEKKILCTVVYDDIDAYIRRCDDDS